MKYNLYTFLVVSSLALLSCSHELNTLEVSVEDGGLQKQQLVYQDYNLK